MKYGDIQLLSGSSLYNVTIEELADDPTFTQADVSRIYYNTATNSYRFNNGTTYVDLSLPANFMALISTLGTSWVNTDFTFNPTLFNAFKSVSDLTANNSLYDVLFQMDAAIGKLEAPALADLSDVTIPGGIENGEILYFNNNQYTFGTVDDLIENFSTIKVATLKDVNSTSPIDGGSLVYNATQQQYNIVQTSIGIEDFFLTTDHSISHSLGVKHLSVTVIDAETDRVINNPTIQFIDANSLDIQLTSPAKIIVILTVPYGFSG